MTPNQAPPKPSFTSVANVANIPANIVPYVANGRTTIALPATGYLARMRFMVNISFTTQAGTAGTLRGGGTPAPFAAIRQITLRNNNGVTFYQGSAWDNYLYNRVARQWDCRNLVPTFDSAATQTLLYNAPAAIAATTAYTVSFPIELDAILSEQDMLGLLLLEGRGTLYLDIDWTDLTQSLYNITAGGISPGTLIVSVQPEIETFLVPPQDPTIAPDQTMMHSVQTYTDPWSTTGTDVYTPLYGGTLLRVWQFYLDTNGNRVSPNYLGNYRAKFGGVNLAESGTVQQLLQKMTRQLFGSTLPDGVIVHDYLAGKGDSVRMPSMRDAVALRDAADFVLETDISTSTPNVGAGGKRVVILETLRRVAAV